MTRLILSAVLLTLALGACGQPATPPRHEAADAQAISGTQLLTYRDVNYGGTSQAFGVGTHRADQGGLKTVGNDAISSLRVPVGYTLKACQHEGAGDGAGTCRTFAAGDHAALGDLDNQISFLQVSQAEETPAPTPDTSLIKTRYTADTTAFPNPERGLYQAFYRNEGPLTPDDARRLRQQDVTLLRAVYVLSDFRASPISEAYLAQLQADLDAARSGGVKLIVRFAYNFDEGGQDADPSVVLRHINEQLGPIFQKNADVIALMEAGFIGAWGEWHSSKSGLDSPQSKRDILRAILSALPTSRMVNVRYQGDKKAVVGSDDPLPASVAFDGSDRARIGHHNDCLLANASDRGTYPGDAAERERHKAYLSQESRFVPVEGETCDPETAPPDCPEATAELARMHWSSISRNYQPAVLQHWKDQGCYEAIVRKLGYRYRMVESSLPSSVCRGSPLSLSIKVTNDGWASAYNPRAVELILRNTTTGQKLVLTDPPGSIREEDPRFWLPGETHTITLSGYTVPADLPAGDYAVLLNLPDPMPSLHDRPEYSIHLANLDTWEAATGYNALLRSVAIQ